MANLVQNPYPIFTDSNGDPLEDGYIFIGEPGLSPITQLPIRFRLIGMLP